MDGPRDAAPSRRLKPAHASEGFRVTACSGEECQVAGENCTQAFKLQQYGRTDIQCCAGQCTEGSENGVLVCQ